MNNYNGYKLKPRTYQIQAGDVIIRIIGNGKRVPKGIIGVARGNDFVDVLIYHNWETSYSDWRAIETRPGSEAKEGDTVYCIEDTKGDCKLHDSFTTIRDANYYIAPIPNHKLLNGKIIVDCWIWPAKHFVVLVKASEEVPYDHSNIIPVDPSEANPGDYVEWTDKSTAYSMTQGKLYKVVEIRSPTILVVLNNRNEEDFWSITRFKRISVPTITADSIRHNPKQTTPNSKGKTMNSNLFTDILKLLMQTEQTDLEKAPSTYAFFYNNEGEYEGTARVSNEAEAKALLQKPEHLGYTMRIYSFSDEFTTQIPVVSTIKKVSTPVAPKAPRTPRKPKA